MTRKNAVELYAILRELKNGSMSKDGLTSFILMRLKLKTIFDEFENAKVEISKDTKPEDFKEGDDLTEWNTIFQSAINEWLNEEIEIIDTHILSNEDLMELVNKNDLVGWIQDKLFEKLTK